MAAIAFLGSALASALLGRAFNKIIDAQEKPPAEKQTVPGDKDDFQLALDQSLSLAKTGAVCKPDTVRPGTATADAGAATESKPVAAAGGLPSLTAVLDGLFSHFRTTPPAAATAGNGAVGGISGGAWGNTSDSTFVNIPGSAAVDTRFDDAANYIEPASTPIKPAAGVADDDAIGKLITQLTATYGADVPKPSSGGKLSTSV